MSNKLLHNKGMTMKLKIMEIMVVVVVALAALGIEYWIYYNGMLKEHMTFFEFLLLIGRS